MLASGALRGVSGGPAARWLPSPEPSGAMLLVALLLGWVGRVAAAVVTGPAAGADVLGGSQLGGGIRSLLGPSSSSS